MTAWLRPSGSVLAANDTDAPAGRPAPAEAPVMDSNAGSNAAVNTTLFRRAVAAEGHGQPRGRGGDRNNLPPVRA